MKNRQEVNEVYNNVRQTLFCYNFNEDLKRFAMEKSSFEFLTDEKLIESMKKIIAFDTNLLWDRNFNCLKPEESICAISSGVIDSILENKKIYKEIISNYNKTGVINPEIN